MERWDPGADRGFWVGWGAKNLSRRILAPHPNFWCPTQNWQIGGGAIGSRGVLTLYSYFLTKVGLENSNSGLNIKKKTEEYLISRVQ